MAGILLVLLGVSGMGRLVEFVPFPVTTGFTAGIAVVIATLQLPDFLGPHRRAHARALPVEAAARWSRRSPRCVPRSSPWARSRSPCSSLWPRWSRRIPAPLVAIVVGGVFAYALPLAGGDFDVATINSRFTYEVHGVTHSGIPRLPPQPVLPWRMPGPGGEPLVLSFALIRALAPAAFAIAMLGAIESLLSAVVADGMTGHKHDSDAELVAQGIGNMVAPFFGGFAATGALARTAANVRAGARSPLAAVFHSIFLLVAVVSIAPLLGYLPMASLAALLLVVAWNMVEWRHFGYTVRRAPRSDVAVLLACFGLTVVFDMVVAVTAGVVMSSLLFMRRMAEVSGTRLIGAEHPELDVPLPRGVLLYEIAGPLFFGAAQKALAAITVMERREVRTVVLDVRSVPALDATGLVALESLIKRLNARGIKVILAGVQPQPMRVLARARLAKPPGLSADLPVLRPRHRAGAALRPPGALTAGARPRVRPPRTRCVAGRMRRQYRSADAAVVTAAGGRGRAAC